MKIAVCDDSAEDRENISRRIKEYETKNNVSFTIDYFESGEALLDALQKNTYHIIFLDAYMGGITGIETAAEIRKTDNDTAIVFTENSGDSTVGSCRVRSAYYLLKPVSYTWFAEVVDMCIFQEIVNPENDE